MKVRRPSKRNVRTNRPETKSSGTLSFSAYLAQLDWGKLRYQLTAVLFLAAWGLLWFKAFEIQLIDGPELARQAGAQHTRTELVEARRGSILDRNGYVLARSVECRSVYANPRDVENPELAAKSLSPILGIAEDKLLKQLTQKRSFVWLSRKVADATAIQVKNADVPGVGMTREYERVYPYKHMAGQLLGFVGMDNAGLEGLERTYNETLAGIDQRKVVVRDATGRGFYSGQDDVNHGKDLNLSLDVQVQFIAEEVISAAVESAKAKWGGVLVVEVQSGDVLAWAQYPFFNPNAFRSSSPAIYRNRLASDALEPGSTFKPFLIGAALEEKIIKPETQFFCENGTWGSKFITIRDDGRSYGDLTTEQVLRYSSNIGMAKMAQTVGIPTFYNYLTRLGFGKSTGIGVGESKGIVRIPRDWSEADLLSAAFGQSISTTGIQMAQGYLSIASGGLLRRPRLVLDDAGFSTIDTEQRIFSSKTAKTLLDMLQGVVDGDGTGKRARIPGIPVAGKTGTAQKAYKTKQGGYGEERLASFAGIVPADQPRYVILVMLDEPADIKYGGTLAAPVFQEVASRTLAYGGYLPGVVFPTEALMALEQKAETPKNQSTKTDSKSNKKNSKTSTPTKAAPPVAADPGMMGIAPSVQGKSVRRALEMLAATGVVPEVRGEGLVVVKQWPAPGQAYSDDGANCILWLSEEN